jgi:hypothetical protein
MQKGSKLSQTAHLRTRQEQNKKIDAYSTRGMDPKYKIT